MIVGPTRIAGAIALALLAMQWPVRAEHPGPRHPDLQGTWSGATLTPLQRPAQFKDRATFTPEEAAEYFRTAAQRNRAALLTEDDRLTQVDIDDTYVETDVIKLDGLRTSLIVDPANGVLPPSLPAAQERARTKPKRSFDDPEVLGLAERCLLGNFGIGGSMASPPMVPSPVIPSYFQIAQTDGYVTIVSEWIHDARIVRMNSAHVDPSIRKWLGDSIGSWDGDTLVVDTTNFRADTRNLGSGERLHVVERLTKVDPKVIRYRVTVEDPDTWATAWTAEWPFKATDARIFPVECHEGNYAIQHFLRGARAEERRRSSPDR
jgi:hypothetical protein